jgi:hypothetical protein
LWHECLAIDKNMLYCKFEIWYDIHHVFAHFLNFLIGFHILEMLFKGIFLTFGHVKLLMLIWIKFIQSMAFTKTLFISPSSFHTFHRIFFCIFLSIGLKLSIELLLLNKSTKHTKLWWWTLFILWWYISSMLQCHDNVIK